MRGNITFTKRQRERDQAERKKEKAIKREQRRTERGETPEATADDGVDPDIAHIIPGPQPIPEEDYP